MRSSQRAALAVTGALVLAVNGGVGWAYWQSGGAEAATGSAGTVVTLTASARPVGNAALYPGVTRSLRVTVRNDNPFPVRVTRVGRGATGATADTAHASAGCRRTGVSITGPAYNVSWLVGAGSAARFTLPDALGMTDESESACQGATFQVPIVVTGIAS